MNPDLDTLEAGIHLHSASNYGTFASFLSWYVSVIYRIVTHRIDGGKLSVIAGHIGVSH